MRRGLLSIVRASFTNYKLPIQCNIPIQTVKKNPAKMPVQHARRVKTEPNSNLKMR